MAIPPAKNHEQVNTIDEKPVNSFLLGVYQLTLDNRVLRGIAAQALKDDTLARWEARLIQSINIGKKTDFDSNRQTIAHYTNDLGTKFESLFTDQEFLYQTWKSSRLVDAQTRVKHVEIPNLPYPYINSYEMKALFTNLVTQILNHKNLPSEVATTLQNQSNPNQELETFFREMDSSLHYSAKTTFNLVSQGRGIQIVINRGAGNSFCIWEVKLILPSEISTFQHRRETELSQEKVTLNVNVITNTNFPQLIEESARFGKHEIDLSSRPNSDEVKQIIQQILQTGHYKQIIFGNGENGKTQLEHLETGIIIKFTQDTEPSGTTKPSNLFNCEAIFTLEQTKQHQEAYVENVGKTAQELINVLLADSNSQKPITIDSLRETVDYLKTANPRHSKNKFDLSRNIDLNDLVKQAEIIFLGMVPETLRDWVSQQSPQNGLDETKVFLLNDGRFWRTRLMLNSESFINSPDYPYPHGYQIELWTTATQ